MEMFCKEEKSQVYPDEELFENKACIGICALFVKLRYLCIKVWDTMLP